MAHVSHRQLTFMTVWVIVSTGLLVLPTIISRYLVQSPWMVGLLFVAGTAPVAAIANALVRRFPGCTLVSMAEQALGRLPGRMAGLVFASWLVVVLGVVGRELNEFVAMALLDVTPAAAVLIPFTAATTACVWRGPVALARTAEFFFPLIYGAFLIISLLGLREADFRFLLPLGAEGPGPILRAALTPVAFGTELTAMLMLAPLVRPAHQVGSSLLRAVLLVGSIGVTAESLTTAVLGFLRPGRTFPHFCTSRLVEAARFMERVDSLFAGLIISGIFIKFAALQYASAQAASDSLGRQAFRPALLVAGASSTALSLLAFRGFTALLETIDRTLAPAAITIQTGLPAAIMLADRIRRARKTRARP